MTSPGILMRLAQPAEANGSAQPPLAPVPNVTSVMQLEADDGKTPQLNTLYFLSDISPILSSASYFEKDTEASQGSVAWVVLSFINGRESSGLAGASGPNNLNSPPAANSVVVINGSTPREDKEQDYHDWYDQEHGLKLSAVPGWNSARRYRLVQSYGSVETANFYGVNFYDAENGLGGPEWQAGVTTEWTLRIRSNAAKPNIRRVWKVKE
ncbi:unnamed protein product [Clonostachys rhizophaga]|uniref:Uncharacterized protein n=1 Tax=Clonostachys rhizophaga TaxID=160324 RepID=A0A9N9YKM5_9HYPO|nr:unnamed protein product [Clonostachys rhizophaga]